MNAMGKILYAEQDGVYVLKFVGDVRLTLGPTISTFIQRIGENRGIHGMVVDLTETDAIDSTSLGLLAKVSLRVQEVLHSLPVIVSNNDDITRILLSMGFDVLFVIVREATDDIGLLGELPVQFASEDELRNQVLEAHQVLMSLNEQNRAIFSDLVEALTAEKELVVKPQLRAVR
jgi:anti-anti-sigma factor